MAEDLDWERLRQVHIAESEERLTTMESAILDLERDPTNLEPIDSLQRDAHTLKGNAGIFGFDAIAQLAHAFEDGLAAIKAGIANRQPAERGAIGLLLRCVDAFRSALPAAQAGVAMNASEESLASRLRSLQSAHKTEETSAAQQTTEIRHHRRIDDVGEEARTARPTLRVEVARVDSLVELTSELAVSRGRMENLLSSAAIDGDTRDILEEAIPLLNQLSDLAMRMRLVPLGPILASQRRTVRDAAQTLDKEVLLHTSGDEVEIDLALVDRINEVLLHLVRNAVAHGIESPAERKRKGKSALGRITLSAAPAAGQVVIEVQDDGAGLNLGALRAKAAELGIKAPSDDLEAAQLAFAPGLSTASQLSSVSGRGVGLDAVKATIEGLAGSIDVHTRPDHGTTFRVRLPLTLAVIRGLVVDIGGQRYVIPIDMVSECVAAPAGLSFQPNGTTILNTDSGMLPLLKLGSQILGKSARTEGHIVVVEHGGQRLGLLVDALVGDTPVVVKSMSRALKSATSIFGAAILGDGYVSLILDIPDIVKKTVALRATSATAPNA